MQISRQATTNVSRSRQITCTINHFCSLKLFEWDVFLMIHKTHNIIVFAELTFNEKIHYESFLIEIQ